MSKEGDLLFEKGAVKEWVQYFHGNGIMMRTVALDQTM